MNTSVKFGFRYLPNPIKDHLKKVITHRRPRRHLYHTTTLVYCLRQAYSKRKYPYKHNTKSQWFMYRGKTFDEIFTSLFPLNQKTYRLTSRGITITGTLDFVYDKTIYDLKMPNSVALAKLVGAHEGYKKQVQVYLALAHANGELTDIHRGRVLMVAENVAVDEVVEDPDILEWLWPRAYLLDAALRYEQPHILPGPEESWECNEEFCPAPKEFRDLCGEKTK